MSVSEVELRLIDGWQRGFPLILRPYHVIASRLGVTEDRLFGMLSGLLATGTLSRIGAVVRPNTAGASTLAALSAPPERLDQVAAFVNAQPGVNHNYEREHDINLWFVVTGPDRSAVAATLATIEAGTGLPVLDLPLQRAYFIDLGFPLREGQAMERVVPRGLPVRTADAEDRRLLAALEDGLPLETRPYRTLARRLGMEEGALLSRLADLIDDGIVSRFGLVVRHRKLGFTANAMVVWDIPEDRVDGVGELFAAQPFVTLCYRRPRRRPRWPYNLFCMVHGRARQPVLDQIETLNRLAGTGDRPQAVLFSLRCFKQRGARLSAA